MQLNMDRMFDQMTSHFGQRPRQAVHADEPNYSLSLRLKDVKDHYEVRARLPDAEASDVKVSLLDNQTLKVDVNDRSNESASTKGTNVGSDITEWNHYDEIIELPGPVKSEHMKVDRAKHELLVTLPKV
jgi:HSP20 family molecular chaperone IbpA